jgi:hypothetical protein
MMTGRRYLLSGFAMILAGAGQVFAAPQRRPAQSAPIPRLPDPSDQSNQPPDTPPLPPPNPKAQLEENQKNLRKDAGRLLELAQELKDDVEKTEQTNVLSLSLVKKAEEAEKLARQIKDLAKGS